jgi:hypothetical protein
MRQFSLFKFIFETAGVLKGFKYINWDIIKKEQ